MKKLLDCLSSELEKAFLAAGYDGKYGRVTVSNRPDLCEFQCNGAMAAAKEYRKAPFMIADAVANKLAGNQVFSEVASVKPGFINLKVSPAYLASYGDAMAADSRLGYEVQEEKIVVVDYGGANVAKPLHVGHLRSAVIGESIKRICSYAGNKVIGDAHLGDWGLQMGLIIMELKEREPELPYFDEDYAGGYPAEPPFTISELEQIYPAANARSKADEAFKESARQATFELQGGKPGYRALWQHILNVSIADLKKNYDRLDVHFEFWGKESDALTIIPDMIQEMKDGGYTQVSEGALVVDVSEEGDAKEVPPCMLLKSDGATLYDTTDLATLVQRMRDYAPKRVIYVVDKRQEMHFIQCFRAARKTGIVPDATELTFLGFGTMNGKDGKPYKTREGGVMRLEDLISTIDDAVYDKMMENRTVSEEEAREIAGVIGLAALKYGDLSNQASKDYIFDVDRFASFEGNTGPYILYTIVRIKSILEKYRETAEDNLADAAVNADARGSEKDLLLSVAKYNDVMETAYRELAPHKICAYVYELSNVFNRFYHETRILSEEDGNRKLGYLKLLLLAKDVLESCIDLLGFAAPDRM